VKARKRFGQHFLEPVWTVRVAEAIAPAPDETFVEVGPGTGALTARLVEAGVDVVAIEIDRDLAARLRDRALPRVHVLGADFLDVAPRDVFEALENADRRRWRLVGNLPYNVSSPILRRLVDVWRPAGLLDATVMLQAEVARRVTARPGSGDYGPLAILVQLHADVTPLLQLPPGAFRPAPQVRSTLVGLQFRAPRADIQDEALLAEVVRVVFTRRRKMLANALAPLTPTGQSGAREVLRAAGLDPARRPETLALDEIARLVGALASGRSGRMV